MPALELLPALLGGFVFVTWFFPTSFWARRLDGYRLVFWASAAGFVFWTLTHGLLHLSRDDVTVAHLSARWAEIVPVNISLSSALVLPLGIFFAALGNGLFRSTSLRRQVILGVIRRSDDPMEALLYDVALHNLVISLTLKSGKVYVGRVISAVTPVLRVESIRLTLLRSGYRDECHTMHLTIDYEQGRYDFGHERAKKRVVEKISRVLSVLPPAQLRSRTPMRVYREVMKSLAREDEIHDAGFQVVVPLREVQSVSHFDVEFYNHYFAPPPEDAAATSVVVSDETNQA